MWILFINALIYVCTGGSFIPWGVANSYFWQHSGTCMRPPCHFVAKAIGLRYDDRGKVDTGVNFVEHGG